MNNSNMMNRMLSNWLGLGVNHMEVMKFGKAFRTFEIVQALRSNKNKSMIGKINYLSVQLALVSACAVVVPAYAAEQVLLTGINTVPLSNNETELHIAFNGIPPNPQAYQLDKPARLVVDLPHAKSGLASRYQDLGSGNARSLAVVDNAERTRLVVNLNQATGYSTRVEGNTLVLKIGGSRENISPVSTLTTTVMTPIAGSRQVANEVTNVDFRRGGSGEGNVLIDH
jgi:type IV pilus assembly protein PilQ